MSNIKSGFNSTRSTHATNLTNEDHQLKSSPQLRVNKSWFDEVFRYDIQEQLKILITGESDQSDICQEHKTRLAYYCHTCEIPICSDCGMLGTKHRDHKFEHMKDIYDQRIDGLKSYLTTLHKRMDKFTKKIKEIDRKSDRELVDLVGRYRTNLELQLREKHGILFFQRSALVKQAEFIQATIDKLNSVLISQSQVEVVQSDEKVVQLLKKAEQMILHNPGDDIRVDMTFEKDFLPSYDLYRFNIPRFSVVSQGGLVWRLRASIEGKTDNSSGHLALFIHLVQGDSQLSRYYIRVEMKHPTRPDSIIREFPFELKAGDVRGFPQFCRVQTLLAKGFVDPNGSYPQLVCGIRPLSYLQRSRDQRRYILELEAQLARYQTSTETIQAATPDTGTDTDPEDTYGDELDVSPVPDQHPIILPFWDDASRRHNVKGLSSPLVHPNSSTECDLQASQPSVAPPSPLRSTKTPLSRTESCRRRRFRQSISHSENSSDSEYDENIEHYAVIPSFTSTEELRQLIHQEFDSWSGNLSALTPSSAPRPHLQNNDNSSQYNSSSSNPSTRHQRADPMPQQLRRRSHSAAAKLAFNSPSHPSSSLHAPPNFPSPKH
ncbi:hypothetical protein L0F63_002522 [Massospora cicadina]|nr:hypothetical protein L0F63_002522 [Massospora cicadina]